MDKSDKYDIAYKVSIIIAGIEVIVKGCSKNITELDVYMILVFIVLSCIGCRLLMSYRSIEFKKYIESALG